jgi:recombination protein RecA
MGSDAIVDVDSFPSGIATLDRALGCGGIPQGRIIEVYGAESSGKTTTCLQFIAACQNFFFEKKKRVGVAAFIDAEHAIDPVWARLIGVNWDNLLFSQPNSGEEGLRIAETMAMSGLVDLIVIDSVAALIPKAELEGEIGDHHVGAQARMMSQAMRKLEGVCAKKKSTIVFINQIREKVGVMFGNPETTPGGRALKFYSSIRIEISKGSKLTGDEQVQGFKPKVKIVKTKVGGKPFAEAYYSIYSGDPISGIDIIASLVDVGLDAKILTKKGNFVNYNGKSLGNGMVKVYATLRENSKLFEALRNQIYDGLYAELERKREKAKLSVVPKSVSDD